MEKSRKQSGFLILSSDFSVSSKIPKVLKSANKKPASRGTAWGIVINETGISGSLRDWERRKGRWGVAAGIDGGRGHLNKICCWLLREGLSKRGRSLRKMRCADHFWDIGAGKVQLEKGAESREPLF